MTSGSAGRRAAGASVAALRLFASLAVFAVVGSCGGCALRDLRPTPPTVVQPVFASDDEALAAAVATYERYLLVSAEIDADGGVGAERLRDLTTERYGLDLIAEYRRMRAVGERFTGAATLITARLIEIDRDRTRLTIAMCVDLSAMQLFDEAGAEVERQGDALAQFEVMFRSANATRILLDGSELWDGEPVC